MRISRLLHLWATSVASGILLQSWCSGISWKVWYNSHSIPVALIFRVMFTRVCACAMCCFFDHRPPVMVMFLSNKDLSGVRCCGIDHRSTTNYIFLSLVVWRVWIDCLSLETTFTQCLTQLFRNVWNNFYPTFDITLFNVWHNHYPTFDNTIIQRLIILLSNVWNNHYPTLDKTFVRR